MFKDTKALAKQLVETAAEPVHTFDTMLKDNPDLLIPLAVIHVVPVALTILGTTQIIISHQRLRAEKERTKQLRIKLMLRHGGHGRHHGFHHGPHGRLHQLVAQAHE